MSKKWFISGVIDPITVIGVLFLIITLSVGIYVAKNRSVSLNINERAGCMSTCLNSGLDVAECENACDAIGETSNQGGVCDCPFGCNQKGECKDDPNQQEEVVNNPPPTSTNTGSGAGVDYPCGYCSGTTCVSCPAGVTSLGQCSSNAQCSTSAGTAKQTAPTAKPRLPATTQPTIPAVTDKCYINGATLNAGSIVVGGTGSGSSGIAKCINGSWTDCPTCGIGDLTFVPSYMAEEYCNIHGGSYLNNQCITDQNVNQQTNLAAQLDQTVQQLYSTPAPNPVGQSYCSGSTRRTWNGNLWEDTECESGCSDGFCITTRQTEGSLGTIITYDNGQDEYKRTDYITNQIISGRGNILNFTQSQNNGLVGIQNITSYNYSNITNTVKPNYEILGYESLQDCRNDWKIKLQTTISCEGFEIVDVRNQNNTPIVNSFANCNKEGMTDQEKENCSYQLSQIYNAPIVGRYIQSYANQNIAYNYIQMGYKSVSKCIEGEQSYIHKQQCNGYQPSDEQFASSVALGTAITAGGAIITATGGAATGALTLTQAIALGMAASTTYQYGTTVDICINAPDSEECKNSKYWSLISTLNMGSSAITNALQVTRFAGLATGLNSAVNAANIYFDTQDITQSCGDGQFASDFGCGAAWAGLIFDAGQGVVDIASGINHSLSGLDGNLGALPDNVYVAPDILNTVSLQIAEGLEAQAIRLTNQQPIVQQVNNVNLPPLPPGAEAQLKKIYNNATIVLSEPNGPRPNPQEEIIKRLTTGQPENLAALTIPSLKGPDTPPSPTITQIAKQILRPTAPQSRDFFVEFDESGNLRPLNHGLVIDPKAPTGIKVVEGSISIQNDRPTIKLQNTSNTAIEVDGQKIEPNETFETTLNKPVKLTESTSLVWDGKDFQITLNKKPSIITRLLGGTRVTPLYGLSNESPSLFSPNDRVVYQTAVDGIEPLKPRLIPPKELFGAQIVYRIELGNGNNIILQLDDINPLPTGKRYTITFGKVFKEADESEKFIPLSDMRTIINDQNVSPSDLGYVTTLDIELKNTGTYIEHVYPSLSQSIIKIITEKLNLPENRIVQLFTNPSERGSVKVTVNTPTTPLATRIGDWLQNTDGIGIIDDIPWIPNSVKIALRGTQLVDNNGFNINTTKNTDIIIPIGRSHQESFFNTHATVSRNHGEININPDGSMTYRDTGSKAGSSYRSGNGEFIPVPNNQTIIITPDTEIRLGNSAIVKVVSENGTIKLVDVNYNQNQANIHITSNKTLVTIPIGRGYQTDFFSGTLDSGASRNHGEVRYNEADGSLIYIDKDSKNGTYYRENSSGEFIKLEPNKPLAITPQTEIRLSKNGLPFRIVNNGGAITLIDASNLGLPKDTVTLRTFERPDQSVIARNTEIVNDPNKNQQFRNAYSEQDEILAQRAASLKLKDLGIKADPSIFENVIGFVERYRKITGKYPYVLLDALINTRKIEDLSGIKITETPPGVWDGVKTWWQRNVANTYSNYTTESLKLQKQNDQNRTSLFGGLAQYVEKYTKNSESGGITAFLKKRNSVPMDPEQIAALEGRLTAKQENVISVQNQQLADRAQKFLDARTAKKIEVQEGFEATQKKARAARNQGMTSLQKSQPTESTTLWTWFFGGKNKNSGQTLVEFSTIIPAVLSVPALTLYYLDQYLDWGIIDRIKAVLSDNPATKSLGAALDSGNFPILKPLTLILPLPETGFEYINYIPTIDQPTDITDVDELEVNTEELTSYGQGECTRNGNEYCDGTRMYELYLWYKNQPDGWWQDGDFTPADFLAMMLVAESTGGDPELLKAIMTATANQLWGSSDKHKPYCTTPDCATGIFNFLGDYVQSAGERYNGLISNGGSPSLDTLRNLASGQEVADYFAENGLSIGQIANDVIYNPISSEYNNDAPTQWGVTGCGENCEGIEIDWLKNLNNTNGVEYNTTDRCGIYDSYGLGNVQAVVFTNNQAHNWSLDREESNCY